MRQGLIAAIPPWLLDFTAGIGMGSMFHDLFDDFVFRIDPNPWHVFSGKFIGAAILTVSFVLLRIRRKSPA